MGKKFTITIPKSKERNPYAIPAKQRNGGFHYQGNGGASNDSRDLIDEYLNETEDKNMNIQTRSEENGLRYFNTVKEAFEAAEKDPSIWKISFTRDGERVRFVRNSKLSNGWLYEPLEVNANES